MKKIAIFILALVFACTLTTAVCGAELSPAISVIRSNRVLTKTCVAKNPVMLCASDIDGAFCEKAEKITVVSLPDIGDGILTLSGEAVIVGDEIKRDDMSSLAFCPSSEHGGGYATFKFTIDDDETERECMIYFTDSLNFAPTADDGYESGVAGVSVWARLCGTDPDGDEVTYKITSYPKNGTVSLDRETGELVYTADSGYIGSDSLLFVACDKYGNVSTEAKMKFVTKMNESGVVYSDMKNSSAHLAAVKMAENGIVIGEKIGEEMYFYPDGAVCRFDLLKMALKTAGANVDLYDISDTGFADNDELTLRARAYINSAKKCGISVFDIFGESFDGERTITYDEASSLVAELFCSRGILGETEASAVDVGGSSAYAIMEKLGVPSCADGSAGVDRATAVKMLYALLLAK